MSWQISSKAVTYQGVAKPAANQFQQMNETQMVSYPFQQSSAAYQHQLRTNIPNNIQSSRVDEMQGGIDELQTQYPTNYANQYDGYNTNQLASLSSSSSSYPFQQNNKMNNNTNEGKAPAYQNLVFMDDRIPLETVGAKAFANPKVGPVLNPYKTRITSQFDQYHELKTRGDSYEARPITPEGATTVGHVPVRKTTMDHMPHLAMSFVPQGADANIIREKQHSLGDFEAINNAKIPNQQMQRPPMHQHHLMPSPRPMGNPNQPGNNRFMGPTSSYGAVPKYMRGGTEVFVRGTYLNPNRMMIHQQQQPMYVRRPMSIVPKPLPPLPAIEKERLVRKPHTGPKLEIRLLIRHFNTGLIIGKGGSNVLVLKKEFKVNVFVSNNQGPERVMTLSGQLGSLGYALCELIPTIGYLETDDEEDIGKFDLRLLIHESLGQSIIGKNGNQVENFKKKSGVSRIKMYRVACPDSTDNVLQLLGKPVNVVNCLWDIVDFVMDMEPLGAMRPYDPEFHDDVLAVQYGGYVDYNVCIPFMPDHVPMPEGKPKRPKAAPAALVAKLAETICEAVSEQRNIRNSDRNRLHGIFDTLKSQAMEFGLDDNNKEKNKEDVYADIEIDFNLFPKLEFFPVNRNKVEVEIPKRMMTGVCGSRMYILKDIRWQTKAVIMAERPPPRSESKILSIKGSPESIFLAQYLLQQRWLLTCKKLTASNWFGGGYHEAMRGGGFYRGNQPRAPWMNEEIMKMVKENKKAYRLWKEQKTPEIKIAYGKTRHLLKRMCDLAKMEYYRTHGNAPPNVQRMLEKRAESERLRSKKAALDPEQQEQEELLERQEQEEELLEQQRLEEAGDVDEDDDIHDDFHVLDEELGLDEHEPDMDMN